MRLTLVERKPEAPGVESFTFKPEVSISWQAGQYLHYVLPHEAADERGAERWFTIASAPFEKTPTVTTRRAAEKGSSFKEKLFSLNPGDTIEADGPEGDFTVDDPAAKYVFIAGGIGITPFHSILKEADHAGEALDVTLLYANRDEQAPYRAELDIFAAHNPKLATHYLIDPERIDEASIRRLVPDLTAPLFYLSGPEPMVKALAQVLAGMGIPESRIKLDDFPGYEAQQG